MKILYATMPLWRPVGSFVMAGIGIYCKINGIDLGDYVSEAMIGTPVLWGVAREADKKRKHREKTFDPFHIN